MVFKSIFGTICAYLAVASLNVSAGEGVRLPQEVSFLGNAFQGDSPYTISTLGITSDAPFPNHHEIMVAYNYDNVLIGATGSTTQLYAENQALNVDDSAGTHWSSYIVRDPTVPAPIAIFLFGSVLVGIVGLARRKTRV